MSGLAQHAVPQDGQNPLRLAGRHLPLTREAFRQSAPTTSKRCSPCPKLQSCLHNKRSRLWKKSKQARSAARPRRKASASATPPCAKWRRIHRIEGADGLAPLGSPATLLQRKSRPPWRSTSRGGSRCLTSAKSTVSAARSCKSSWKGAGGWRAARLPRRVPPQGRRVHHRRGPGKDRAGNAWPTGCDYGAAALKYNVDYKALVHWAGNTVRARPCTTPATAARAQARQGPRPHRAADAADGHGAGLSGKPGKLRRYGAEIRDSLPDLPLGAALWQDGWLGMNDRRGPAEDPDPAGEWGKIAPAGEADAEACG